MSRTRVRSLERIAITLRAGAIEVRGLSAFARLAAEHAAELSGVFIEDVDLLRAAALPLSLELCRTTNVVRPMESGTLARQLREQAALAERSLAATAETSGAKWSFRTVRERATQAVLETARQVDVTVIYPDSAGGAGRNVVAVVDRSPAALRALAFAGRFADAERTSLRVIVVGRTHPGLAKTLERLAALRPDIGEPHPLYRPTFRDIVAIARGERPAGLVLPLALVEAEPDHLDTLREMMDCPALIVR